MSKEDKIIIKLSKISTRDIVNELLKREGVESKIIEPYADDSISANGPAILINVID